MNGTEMTPEHKTQRLATMLQGLLANVELHKTIRPEAYTDNDNRWIEAARTALRECDESAD